jgi:hypothetical protein
MKLLEEMDYSSDDDNEQDKEIVKKLDGIRTAFFLGFITASFILIINILFK